MRKIKEDKLSQGGVASYVDTGEVQSDAEIAQKDRSPERLPADAELGEKNRSSGFTLLEVMIALSIIAIALVALMGLAQRSITVNDQVQQITRATLLAQSKMAEIEAGVETDAATTGQVFPEPDQDYRWSTNYSPTPVNGVQQVDLTVAWGQENRNEAVRLISFVFRGGGS